MLLVFCLLINQYLGMLMFKSDSTFPQLSVSLQMLVSADAVSVTKTLKPFSFGGSHGTMVVHWTVGQQAKRSILH